MIRNCLDNGGEFVGDGAFFFATQEYLLIKVPAMSSIFPQQTVCGPHKLDAACFR